jgi:hypothetical protein
MDDPEWRAVLTIWVRRSIIAAAALASPAPALASGIPTTERLRVGLGSEVQSTETLTTAFAGFNAWRPMTMAFMATSSSEVLSFLAIGAPNGNPPTVLLDSVVLQIPEPSTGHLIIVGLLFLIIGKLLSRKWHHLMWRG